MALDLPLTSWIRANRRLALAVACVLLVSGGVVAQQGYARIEPSREVHQSTRWTEKAAFTYDVPVTRNSTHIPVGTVLPMGEPAYYRTVSDHLDVSFRWSPQGAPDTRGVAQGDLALKVQALSQSGDPYWSIDKPLASSMVETKDALALDGRIDLDELSAEVAQVMRELPPGDGRLNFTIRATVTYAMGGAAQRDADRSTFDLPMGWDEPRFHLPAAKDLAWEKPHVSSFVVVHPQQAGWSGVLSSLPALALLAAGATLAVVAEAVGDRRATTDAAYERERRRYREWITDVPAGLDEGRLGSPIDVATLADLVHVAADARARVLHDPTTRIYYVALPGATTYRFAGQSSLRPLATRFPRPASERSAE